uniref:Uncharacterized protein n=1 Tax=Cyprinus carpio TaxID=7962 RepID=A0A8C1P1A4_CYPCA
MESSKVISTDKATVIIQVNSQVAKDTLICDGQQARVAYHNTALKGFLKAQPKALGAVQIMTGVTVFLFGIIRTTDVYNFPAVALFSGITYWGSLVVKASLGMNVVSAVTAGLAIVLMGIQLRVISMDHPSLHAEKLRVVGIMLVFTVPQFIISICISAFACKATSNIESTVINVLLN